MQLLDGIGYAGTGTAVSGKPAFGAKVHVFSASTSVASVVIEGSFDGVHYATFATITNPSSAGEVWMGPNFNYLRARVATWGSGTIYAYGEFIENPIPFYNWQNVTSSTATTPTPGFIGYSWTNAQIVAGGSGGTTYNLRIGAVPAKARYVNCILVVDTQATFAAGTLTGSVGFTGASYVDLLSAGSLKAAAGTVYGDAAAERATDIGSIYSATAKDIYLQFAAGAGDLANVTTCTGHVLLDYLVYPI